MENYSLLFQILCQLLDMTWSTG